MIWRGILIVLLGLTSTQALANGDDCEEALSVPSIEGALSELPPLPLDLPTVREGVRKLIDNLTPLHRDFATLKKLEEDMISGKLNPELGRKALDHQYDKVSRQAAENLNQWNGKNAKGRELLEGYKILLKRLQSSKGLSESLARQKAARDDSKEEEEGPSNPESKEALREMAREQLAKSARQELQKKQDKVDPKRSEQKLNQMGEKELKDLIQNAAKNFKENKKAQDFNSKDPQNQKLEEKIRERMSETRDSENREQSESNKDTEKSQNSEKDNSQENSKSEKDNQSEKVLNAEQKSEKEKKQSSDKQKSPDVEKSPEKGKASEKDKSSEENSKKGEPDKKNSLDNSASPEKDKSAKEDKPSEKKNSAEKNKSADKSPAKSPSPEKDKSPDSAKSPDEESESSLEDKVLEEMMKEAKEKSEKNKEEAKKEKAEAKEKAKQKAKEKAEQKGSPDDSDEDGDQESENPGDGKKPGEKGKNGKGEKSQKGDNSEKGEGEDADGESETEGQGENSVKGKSPGKGDKPGKGNQDGEPSDEDGDGESDSQGKSGDKKAGDKKSGEKSSETKKQGGKDNAEGGERRPGAEEYDKADTTEADSDFADGSGSDGQIEGGGTGEKAIGKDLAKFLKNLDLDKLKKDSAKKKDPKEKDKKSNTKAETKSETKQDIKSERTPGKSPERKKESFSGKKPSKSPLPKQEKLKVEDREQAEMVAALLKVLWKRILESYDNSDSFFAAINQFATIANKYGAQLRADNLRQEGARALDFYQKLNGQGVTYKNFEDLANSLVGSLSDGGGSEISKVKFLHALLSEKHRLHLLTSKEEPLFNLVSKILESQTKANATDEQVVAAFLKRLLGPLSLNTVTAQYADTSGRINIAKMAADIRAGRLTDLILYPRLEPYINILLNEQEVPSVNHRYDGPEVPINNADFDLVQADEIDEMPQFYRDGAPLNLDLVRLLSGDMLRLRYQDEVERFDPKKPKPKKVSVVLVDMSGSMGQHNKWALRNSLMNAYLDKSQRDVVRDGGEHVVTFIKFDAHPKTPERLGSIEQAQGFFKNLREHPLSAGGDDSITGAVVKAYQMIHEEEIKGGGELEKANILLLTDAIAPVDFGQIKMARSKLSEKTQVKLNALTMGDYNEDVTQLVEMAGDGAIGEVYHQHIPYPEVESLMKNHSLELVKDAVHQGKSPDVSSRTMMDLSRLANAVALQFSHRRMDSASYLRDIGAKLNRALAANPGNGDHNLSKIVSELVNKQLAKNWSVSERAEMIAIVLQECATLLKVNIDQIYGNLSEGTLRSLLKWIGEE